MLLRSSSPKDPQQQLEPVSQGPIMGNWNWFWRKQECCETDFPDQLVAKYRNTLHSFPSNRPTGFGIIFKRNTRWSGRIKSFSLLIILSTNIIGSVGEATEEEAKDA